MLLLNARLEPVESPAVAQGFLQIQQGKITAMGKMGDPLPKDQEVYDLSGYTVYPGFVDAHCHIGMWEDGLNFEGDDGNEQTDPVTPQLRAIDAVNPMEHCFEEALQGGVTTVLTGPGSANAIGGSWCAMKTMGRRIDDMVIDPNVGMKFALGENPKMALEASEITEWLLLSGYLKHITRETDGAHRIIPTEKGEKLGITRVERIRQDGKPYHFNLYSTAAQKFIRQHLEEILSQSSKRLFLEGPYRHPL